MSLPQHHRDEKSRTSPAKSEAFNRGILRSLKSHIAVIDGFGNIIAVNEAWNNFSLENGETTLQCTGEGSNYLDVCSTSARKGDDIALKALRGIMSVIDKDSPSFYLEYPCHSPTQQRWFAMRAARFVSPEPLVVISHEEITELKKAEEDRDNTLSGLELRVEERTRELIDKNTNILDSINYAKRIQVGLLSRDTLVGEIFSKSFILSKPRDIVSGDFFWCYQRNNKKFIVAADCTGHGVPGALMSIICNNLLDQIVVDEHIENPSEILELLDKRLKEALQGDSEEIKDGMDIVLCVFDAYFSELYFGGANRPLFISDKSGKIRELPPDRHSIGGAMQEVNKKFETKRFQIVSGQRIYLCSDGYYSQFGGPKQKKLMKSRFKHLLGELQNEPIDMHKDLLQTELTTWTGVNEQVDDVLVVGIEF